MYLFKYILKRVGLMFLTLMVIFTMCFVFVKLLPNMPAEQFGKDMELIMRRREMLGYDKPIMEQYVYYLFGRTGYIYDKLDVNGNKIQSKDSQGNLEWVSQIVKDEHGDTVYKTDANGNHLNQDGAITTDPALFVPVTEPVLDKDGNKIPIYEQETVFDKSKIPEGVEYTRKGMGGVIRGYFGTSEVLYLGRDVWEVFAQKIPYTVALNIYSIVLSIPLGIALGIFAALKKNKWQDHVISTGVMIFVSVPSFIYAFLVQYILFFQLGWSKSVADAMDGAWSWSFFKSIIPAILSMSFGTIAGFARYTRAELTEVLTNEFMLLARTKGLTKAQAVVRHALRNAMVVIFPMILGEFISVMSGSLIIEQLFSIPGVGQLYIKSIQAQPTPDYNFFMLLTGFYTLIGLTAGIVIDISYGIIDPRIRMGAR